MLSISQNAHGGALAVPRDDDVFNLFFSVPASSAQPTSGLLYPILRGYTHVRVFSSPVQGGITCNVGLPLAVVFHLVRLQVFHL